MAGEPIGRFDLPRRAAGAAPPSTGITIKSRNEITERPVVRWVTMGLCGAFLTSIAPGARLPTAPNCCDWLFGLDWVWQNFEQRALVKPDWLRYLGDRVDFGQARLSVTAPLTGAAGAR